jgi:glucan biosynthesis protein C
MAASAGDRDLLQAVLGGVMSASMVNQRAAPSLAARHPATAVNARRYELDWLRTAAVFGLIPFHTAIIFTATSFDYVKNAQSSPLMNTLTSLVSIWGIPLLFLVAGGAARFALASRSTSQYLNERVTRLLIPFTFGMLVIVPLQIYVGQLAAANRPSLPAFYLRFLQTLEGVVSGHFPPGPEWIGHLWFLPPLMVFAALAIPFAALLRAPGGSHAVRALAQASHHHAVLWLFGLPLAAVQFTTLVGLGLFPTIDTRFAGNAIGVLAFLIFFLYGYLLYVDERFLDSVRRDAWVALLLGVLSWLVIMLIISRWSGQGVFTFPDIIAVALTRGYCSWWWVMGILGLAMRYLQFITPTLTYLTRAAYPIYLIHMPILSFIALWVVRMDLGVWVKFGLIVSASFVVSLAIYDLLIRRVKPLRLLFGLSADAGGGAMAHPI